MADRKHWVWFGVAAVAIGYGVFGSGSDAKVWFADRTTASGEDIATPLVGSVGVQKRGGVVRLYLKLQDANGKAIRSVRLPGGSRPEAPSIEIFDAEGQKVHACKLRYG